MVYPYNYRVFGLTIGSEIPVAGFETASAEMPDVVISLGTVPQSLPEAVHEGVLYQATDREFLLKVDNVARYYVAEGAAITVQPAGNASPQEISAFLNSSSFAALLRQRRMLPMRASTVLHQNGGVMICGLSGAGKSTLAAALLQAGASLAADEISVMDFSRTQASVRPAFPAIKIWADSLKHLGIPVEGLIRVRGKLRRYYLPVEQFVHEPVEILRVFVLNTHNKRDLETKEVHGIDKFTALSREACYFRGIRKSRLNQNDFALISKLAAAVPVTVLTRPNDEFNTERLVRYLLNL